MLKEHLKEFLNENNATIEDRELSHIDLQYTKECIKRWIIHYKQMTFSIYRDNCDSLATVGEPYYEFYIINYKGNKGEYVIDDVIRFYINEIDEIENFLTEQFDSHSIEYHNYPERFV
jgi:hypothetical protein